ncbi:MAG: nucleotidyltransferase [Bacteroidetes bacterium GWA2_30_7]|nr:MAG: nucleotidyltransferase [Bacteroidetes bacterium GWA2_30_7]
MLQPIIKKKIPQIIELFKAHNVIRAYAFGSVCTKNFNKKSDIDLLIAFQNGIDPLQKGQSIWDLEDALMEIFHRKIDLLTENQLKNPYLIESINKSKQLIYEA